jgi:hypothetical protein
MGTSTYEQDARTFFSLFQQHMSDEMSRESTVQALLFYALGLERLLKHSLAKINPLYILEKPHFRDSVRALYHDKLLPDPEGVEKDADGSVVAFRTTITRALAFSSTAKEHKQTLFQIASWRDIVAHRPLSELDLARVERALKTSGFPIVQGICAEQGLSVLATFGSNPDMLVDALRQAAGNKLAERIKVVLESHRILWEHRLTNDEFVAQARVLTDELLDQSTLDHVYDTIPCPACGNDAIVRIEPQYDTDDGGGGYVAGFYVDYVSCKFCSLRIDEHDELQELDVDALLSRSG